MTYDKIIRDDFDRLVEETAAILRYESVEDLNDPNTPYGQAVADCLQHFLALGESMGFQVKNVDGQAGHIDFGEGDEIVGILAHLDVVPAGDGWTVPPYAGEVKDGHLYGRGTLDDKGPAMASLFAMKALKESGFEPKKKIRLILGTNEETGWGGIKYYLDREKAPDVAFTPDADFPVIYGEMGILVFDLVKPITSELDDGGIALLSIEGGNRPNMVPDHAEARLKCTKPIDHILKAYLDETGAKIQIEEEGDTVLLTATGKSAHGSTPHLGRNAISDLMGFLTLIDLKIGDRSGFVRTYEHHIGSDLHGERIGCALEDEASGKLIFNVGTVHLDEKEGRLVINIRYPIAHDSTTVLDGIRSSLEPWGFHLEKINDHGPISFEKDHPLITTLTDVYADITGERLSPITIGGGTYARALENAVAFGPLFPGQEELAHQPDERISLKDLERITRIYAEALYRLGKSV